MEKEIKANLEELDKSLANLEKQYRKGVITEREYLEKQLDLITKSEREIFVIARWHQQLITQ